MSNAAPRCLAACDDTLDCQAPDCPCAQKAQDASWVEDSQVFSREFAPDKPLKVHASQGQGGMLWNTFDSLEEALTEVRDHEGEASFGIEYPDGTWHQWE